MSDDELDDLLAGARETIDAMFPPWYLEGKKQIIMARVNDRFSLADLKDKYGWDVEP